MDTLDIGIVYLTFKGMGSLIYSRFIILDSVWVFWALDMEHAQLEVYICDKSMYFC